MSQYLVILYIYIYLYIYNYPVGYILLILLIQSWVIQGTCCLFTSFPKIKSFLFFPNIWVHVFSAQASTLLTPLVFLLLSVFFPFWKLRHVLESIPILLPASPLLPFPSLSLLQNVPILAIVWDSKSFFSASASSSEAA